MHLFKSATVPVLLASIRFIHILALPTPLPLNTKFSDSIINHVEDLTSESLPNNFPSNNHVPTAKISRYDSKHDDCAPIGFKNGHKICDPRCDPENCNNLPVRDVIEGGREGELDGDGEEAIVKIGITS
ncbi:hypothetical protein BKA64DRAFT_681552 [Cadophora sp. MPI-SDFR-AT-0126]|nr:hypothetical protein BKA64DRAFT_681552 [Leotiomycetes sp. MPI-SDFR-AT-0126]